MPLLASLAIAATAGAVIGWLPLEEVGASALAASLVLIGAVAYAGRQHVLLAVGLAVYVLSIHWVYESWIVPAYGYEGLIETGPGWPSLLFVSTIALLPSAWLPVGLKRPSELVLWVLYLLGYVPATTIPIHLLGPGLGAVLPLELTLAAAFAILAVMQRAQRPSSSWPTLSEQTFGRLLEAIGLAMIAFIVIVYGPPAGLPSLASVYDTRAQDAAIQSGNLLAGYLVPWAANVVFPLLLGLGLARRRPWPAVLGIGGLLLVYSVTGAKTALFAIALIPLLYLGVRYGRRAFAIVLACGSAGALWLSVAATASTGSLWPLALFPTRVLAVTGQLTGDYYEFFSTHATYQLATTLPFRLFVESPYGLPSPRLIGAVYFGTPTVFANANLWADAMANFGLLGIPLFTIALGLVLWVFDIAGGGRDLEIIGPLLGLIGFTLAQGSLETALLTSGIWLAIVLIAVMPQHGRSDQMSVSLDDPRLPMAEKDWGRRSAPLSAPLL
jgi:hypothetical protein